MSRAVGITVLLAIGASIAGATRQGVVRMSESSIRRLATAKPVPVYPPASIAAGRTGVAVAAIVSQPDGRVASVTILESPDDATGAALREALLKWVIEPTSIADRPERLGISGRVTFYFRIEKGQARVLSPEEMPGGPMPEPAGGPPGRGPAISAGRAAVTPPPVMAGGHAVPPEIEIGDAELKALQAREKVTIVDIRERDAFRRGHREGAVNIPRDELVARGGIELDPKRPLIIDCSQSETPDCRNVANSLIRLKRYPKVLIYLP